VFVDYAAEQFNSGKLSQAEKGLAAALLTARKAAPEEAGELLALVYCTMSALRQKQNRGEEARTFREQALASLTGEASAIASPQFHRLMAWALEKLGEHRRALSSWEQAIRLVGDEMEPTVRAGLLVNMGNCYNRMGLRDHGAVPLRAAVKVYRCCPEDPRLPIALINLGNALRKSAIGEAEACYKEAGEWHAAKLQYESACSAWVNLGVLCSENGRQAEALAHYERALNVREKTRGVTPVKVASVLNNMANCYRRMGRFSEAHALMDRAATLIPAEDDLVASSYGTRGHIYLDEGEDAKAVEWLRKAIAERKKQPSPNLELMAENLEREIVALKRLGREEEAAAAQVALASVRSALETAAQVESELTAAKDAMSGAVLVELAYGSRMGLPDGRKDTTLLTERLSAEVRARNAGYCSGWVAVPENTTLIFYGPDAEALFKSLDPMLRGEPICAGARVAIRQGDVNREVVVPRQTQTLN
jgi:tetratricopeptide (TPR) repeat protein